jgi:glycosyltransferase involved in cell wall biosynthesis
MAATEARLRVLIPTPLFPPNIGGIERLVDVLSQRLVARGLFVTVLTTDRTGTLPPHEEKEGVQILRVPAWPRNRDYLFAPDIYRIVARNRWDIVHVQSYHTFVAPLAMLAARRSGIPYVLTFHGGGHSSAIRRALRRPHWAALRPLLARADRLVSTARFEIDHFSRVLRLPPERFVLIRTGTDLPSELPPREREHDPSLIASVGRLERYKGHHRVIEALPAILRERPDARLWVAGSGPYEAALQQQARELGVAERVEIRGVPADRPDEMASQLSRAALVVLLSEYETLPGAVLEALAQRIPVLVTHNSGLGELADLGLARAIPNDSGASHVAAAVLEQLRTPYIPERIDLPTSDESADRHVELYREILAARSRSRR